MLLTDKQRKKDRRCRPTSDPGSRGDDRRLISLLILAAAAACTFFICGCTSVAGKRAETDAYPMTRDTFLLDTFCELTIYAGGGEEAMDAAMEALGSYDALLDYNKEDSDLYRINHRTSDRVEIDPETADLLETAAEFRTLSGGALEPAIRPVTLLWDFKEKKEVPAAEDLKKALGEVAGGGWHVEKDPAVFVADDARARIDVGAVAKGFIADRIKETMLEHGVSSAIVNLGGNVQCIGKKPDGSPFRIAIRDPRSDDGYGQVLELDDCSAVTAGIYERCFEKDGVTYHHILDPVTGMPVQNGLFSVTVTGPSSACCDAMCTAAFVLGREDGEAMIRAYNESRGTEYSVYFNDID